MTVLEKLTPAQQSVLQTIKAQREKLDAKVNAAIEERNAFIASVSNTVGHIETGNRNRRSNRKPMSAAQRKKLSDSKKLYWKNRKAAKK